MFGNNHHRRYDDYYLVNQREMEEYFIEDEPDRSCYWLRRKKKKICMIVFLVLISLFVVAFLVAFVAFPLVFKYTLSLQQALVFTRFGLPTNKTDFEKIWFPGFRNLYVSVKGLEEESNKTLGVYQILPTNLTYLQLHDPKYDFDNALMDSNYSVLLYFRGTGEARNYNIRKYQIMRFFFHVIAFDYRGYGDSSEGFLSEKTVVHDCVQLFKWLKTKTNSSIYLWGHSLGSSLALHALADLEKQNESVAGLILESSFTTLADEIVVHPILKYFSWVPWFSFMILEPLKENGFVFDSKSYIMEVHCPIMLLHSETDSEVPYTMSQKLYHLASERNLSFTNNTILHIYNDTLSYDHIYIYVDPYLPYYILEFKDICEINEKHKANLTDRIEL